MIERKAFKKLLAWKTNQQGSTALLIEGAHSVGKSTLAEEFGRKHYRSYLLIDFSLIPKEAADFFEDLRKSPIGSIFVTSGKDM